MNLLLASFIFTTNNLATVLGPFAAVPPVGICCDTHKRIDLTRANWELRERCGWYDCDVSARPETHSNEVAVVTGYVPASAPSHGYVAQYEIRWVPVPPDPPTPTPTPTPVTGNPSLIVSKEPNVYRSGRTGEMGYGWAYTALDGTANLRYAAYAPDSEVAVSLGSSGDPVSSHYGSSYAGADLSRELTSLGMEQDPEYGGEKGKYDMATYRYSFTNGIPVRIVVGRNAMSAEPTSVSLEASYDEGLSFVTADGVSHWCYSFAASGTSVTYRDSWQDPGTGTYGDDSRGFSVGFSATGEIGYSMSAFGGTRLVTDETKGDSVSDLVERTGRRGELGTGWGYKRYEFKTDRRTWKINAPGISVAPSNTTDRSTIACGHAEMSSTVPLFVDPFGANPSCLTARREIARTYGKYGSDSCSNATYRVAVGFGTSGIEAVFEVSGCSVSGADVPAVRFVPDSRWAFRDGMWLSTLSIPSNTVFTDSSSYPPGSSYKTRFCDLDVAILAAEDGTIPPPASGRTAYAPFLYSVYIGVLPSSYRSFSRDYHPENKLNAIKFTTSSSMTSTETEAYTLSNSSDCHTIVDEVTGILHELRLRNGVLTLEAAEE